MRSELKILHLDDDALYLEQFSASLLRTKLDVTMQIESADTVAEYFALLASYQPEVVVLDIDIGGAMCGADVARKTKELAPAAVVFMCSDLKGIGIVSACLSAGADDFIFKRSDDRELALRIYGTWKLRTAPVAAPGAAVKGVVGRSMEAVATRLVRIANSAVTAVHVRGESGTGKELVSEILAAALPQGTPFIRINCGAIAPTLLESELFGHVRGAFTGASSDKAGILEAADGGWVFFDEVATLSMAAQVALLRVLESRKVRRVGAAQERPIRIRILSATNEPIETLIAEGRFRADLWQRLCESSIELPPLRERMDEFPEIVRYFASSMEHGPFEVTAGTLSILASYDWHEGNVRELRNCLRAMTELAVGGMLTPLSIPKWFWEKQSRQDEVEEEAGQNSSTLGAEESDDRQGDGEEVVRLTWLKSAPPAFEMLCYRLLLEIIRREAESRGKVSVRHLARLTSIPKSSLSAKLRHLIDSGLVQAAELSRLVNIGQE